MRCVLTHVMRVTPATFWERIFFDDAYNRALYEKLGFEGMRVISFESPPDGAIRRELRAEPPMRVPAAIKRKLQGKVYYTEYGQLDVPSQTWAFRTVPSVIPDQLSVVGSVHLAPHPRGALHSVELVACVSAWGIGSLIESVIERNSRESFATTAVFTDRWAEEKGLI